MKISIKENLMNTNQLDKIYQKIAIKLDELIPVEWDKLYLFCGALPSAQELYFYFYPNDSLKPIYCVDIPTLYNVDEDSYELKEDQLWEYFEELRDEFIEINETPWHSITFILDSSGSFKIDLDYEEFSFENSIQKGKEWKKKYLGLRK